ncbi:MAG: YidC/Oxa1 family membrane protein insertase [Candidatus Gracilibacteria bacterium]|nr:YidC/Oxa1 family membrane protein insertase [Candidatus Gracilibacteria bacterium]
MKDKIFNFLLLFLLIFLTINLFSKKETENKLLNTIIINTQSAYTIPASIKVDIKNETLTGFTFNTCDNFSIKKDSNIIKYYKCENIVIKSGETYKLDFSKDFSKFEDIGKYFINLKKDNIDVISQFEIENRGFFGKFFVFFFYAPIYNLMAFLLEITSYSLGWAIIIITIIIRLILLIPQHKMMVSQRKMQVIQPKIKEIQEKHKGNHQMLGVELMKLYKDEKVNPMGSCGLLLIQMPILLVIYNVIVGIQDTSNIYYLYGFLGDYNMLNISSNFFGINLYGIGGISGIILAILVGILQFIQVKLSMMYTNQNNKKTGVVLEKKKDSNSYSEFMPDPEMLNKFMLYGMPIMIAFVTYSFFAGVGLYWGIGTIFMIIQQLFVNKILKK